MNYTQFSSDRLLNILQLGKRMHEESSYASLPFDAEKAAGAIMQLVVDNDSGFGVIAYDEDTPVGLIAGGIGSRWFSPSLYAYDHVWYVVPEYRGSRTAIRMLKMFESWAKDQGAEELWMGVTTNIDPERTGSLFTRLGYEHVGGNYKAVLHV